MTTSLSTFLEMVRRDLRDTSATPTFSDDELTDLIIAGISELGQFYPKEVVVDIDVADFTLYRADLPEEIEWVFRVERYDADGTFRERIPESPADQRNGWQVHADGLYIPPGTYADGATLKLWGYGAWSNFGWPSDAEGGWWASGDAYAEFVDPGIHIGAVKTGDAFAIWSSSPGVIIEGATYAEYNFDGTSYDVVAVFTEDGDVYVKGGSEISRTLIHKLSNFVLLGA